VTEATVAPPARPDRATEQRASTEGAASTFAKALSYWPAVRGRFMAGLVCVIPSTAVDLGVLLIVREVVNGVFGEDLTGGDMAFTTVAWWAAAVMGLAIVKAFSKYAMRLWVTGASRRFEQFYRQDLFEHLMTLSPQDIAHVRTGDIMARSVSDIEAVRMLLGPAVMYNAQSVLVLPAALTMMAIVDTSLMLAMLVPYFGLALVIKFAAKPTQRWTQLSQERLADLSVVAQENISGIRVVKAFATEAFSESVFKRMGRAFLEANVHVAVIRGTTGAVITIIRDVGVLLIVMIGGWHIIEGRITVGDFMFFLMAMAWSLWPLIAVGWALGMYHRAAAGARRLNEVFAIRPSIADAPEAVSLSGLRGELELRDLSWAWNGAATLTDINIKVPAGTTLGITGRTGSGKSTLVQLLSRQIEPPTGTVFLDGIDITRISLSALRKSMGVVPQDSFLFSETIRSNIAFASDDIGLETVQDMARAAHVHEDIEAFPHGYDEMLGERGVTLSGGQRQRATIARALAADPPILILDDCLSAVDSVTEQAILRGLQDTLKGRTAVIVSHRVSALALAGHIVVLDEGRVVEQGTHGTLTASGGLYAKLRERQELEAEIEEL
jgi:ATP-binding cassette subfamily B protein